MADTESFTFRMPLDIKQEIEKRAEKRKRSEFVIQLLREALGLAEPEQQKTDSVLLESRLIELNHLVEVMKTQQDTILHRLTMLENSSTESERQGNTQSKTEEEEQETKPQENKKIDSIYERQSKTISNTVSEEITIPLDINITKTIPESAKKVTTKELIEILNQEDPRGKWSSRKLQRIREGSRSKSWQIVGKYRFIHTQEPFLSRKQGHLWWVDYSKS